MAKHREDTARPRLPFDIEGLTVAEQDARPEHQVAHRARHQYLVRRGRLGDPDGNVDGDTSYVGVDHLAFAGVQAGPRLQSDPSGRVADAHRAMDGPARAVEPGEDALAPASDLLASKSDQVVTDHLLV